MIVITVNMRGQKVSQSRCKSLKADYEKYCILKMIQEQENAVHFVPQSHLLMFVCVCCQGAAAYPENEDQQQRLREAAEGLRVATNAAAQNAIKKKLINRLEVSEFKSEQTTRH